jgi:hypothetical protein
MWQGNPAKRQNKIGASARDLRPAICRTDRKNEALCAFVAKTSNESRNLLRRELLAATVEQNHISRRSAGLPVQPLKHRSLRRKDLRFARHIAPRPFDVLGQQPFGGLVFRTPRRNSGKSQLHTPSVLSSYRKYEIRQQNYITTIPHISSTTLRIHGVTSSLWMVQIKERLHSYLVHFVTNKAVFVTKMDIPKWREMAIVTGQIAVHR